MTLVILIGVEFSHFDFKGIGWKNIEHMLSEQWSHLGGR